MNLKVITVTTNTIETEPLLESLRNNGWEYACLTVPQWLGFGTKLITTYNFLKEHEEIDAFIFCDAFDVVALGNIQEFENNLGRNKDKIILSAERNCWPDKSLERWYEPRTIDGWDFVNSGLYYAPRDKFIEMVERHMPTYDDDDQLYMSKMYLFEFDDMLLDSNCMLFQSYSFINNGDFSYDNSRVKNLNTDTNPVFIHGNGRTDMTKVRELCKR